MSPKIKEAFESWITVATWYTGHAQDESRFFRFVWTVCSVSRKPPSAEDIRREIKQVWTGRLDKEYLDERALHFSQLYETLYDFGKARNAPRLFLTDDNGNPRL